VSTEGVRGEAGFTLVEVLLGTALFVFVALAAFETLRQLGAHVAQLAQRGTARAQLVTAIAMLRSDAVSAVAVWKPASACGDAVAFMQRDAAGTHFVLYRQRGAALVRTGGPAPLDPCDATLPVDTLIATIASLRVSAAAATALPAHVDALSGAVDGGLLIPAGIANVAADVHAQDVDGTPIRGGNGLVEVTIDADPRVGIVDLVAGSRPSGYTQLLSYACGGRCAANGPFPEIRGGDYASCRPGFDFQNTSLYYVPATVATQTIGGQAVFRVTSYWVTGAYTFAFGGVDATSARRTWKPAVWPPGAASVDDPYPVDYANNAVAAAGPAQVAGDLGEPAAFAAELADCSAMNADAYFRN